MKAVLIAVSSVLVIVSYIVYAAAILKGKAKPHRTTRFVTFLIAAIATVALLAQGSAVAIWLSGTFAVGSLIIFLLTVKFGMGGWSRTDILCLIISIFGIAFWQQTNNPMYALVSSIGADFVGQIPMLIKTYRYPETETWVFYFLDATASLLTILAVGRFVPFELAVPTYVFLLDSSITVLILRPKIARRSNV
jgi:hypothetical protein